MENYFLMGQLGSEDFVQFIISFKENSYLQQTR